MVHPNFSFCEVDRPRGTNEKNQNTNLIFCLHEEFNDNDNSDSDNYNDNNRDNDNDSSNKEVVAVAVVVTTIKKLMHLIVIAMYLENPKEHRYDKVGTTDAVPTIHNPATLMVKNPTSHGCHHICPQWTQAPSRIVSRQ